MQKPLQEKITFKKIDYSDKDMSMLEFDSCTFVNCTFSKTDLSNTNFLDCRFEECSFTLVKLNNTGLQNIAFSGCKLLGIDFTKCRDFLLSFSFEKCTLDYSIFCRKKIKNTIFNNCSIKEADFSEADLTASCFLNCDLTRTLFMHTVLEKADFRTAFNYSFDLELNSVKKARFSSSGIIGLLDKYKVIIE